MGLISNFGGMVSIVIVLFFDVETLLWAREFEVHGAKCVGITNAGQPHLSQSVSPVQTSCPQVISNSVFHFQSVLVYTINYMSIIRHRSNISCQLKSNTFTVER